MYLCYRCTGLGPLCARSIAALAVVPGTIQRRWRSDSHDHTTRRIRNVGIVAHIDAGKTTTTERMLYLTGATHRIGNVDRGDTVTDYLDQERERGISITSAAVTFLWDQHRINLIDTPGHVDFTFEVERSLKVLDGTIAVFDGSTGVEAQSVQVWRQANQYNIPRIAFINKMDRPNASLVASVVSMEKRLKTTPLVLQMPVGQAQGLRGLIDLVDMELIVWEPGSDGSQFSAVPLVQKGDFCQLPSLEGAVLPSLQGTDVKVEPSMVEKAVEERSKLTDQVLTLDTELLDEVFTDSFDPVTLPPHLLRRSIRGLTLNCMAVPVLCGSALRNIGIQPLLSAITHYLPSPQDSTLHIPPALSGLYAYAFKVIHDPRRGPLVFLRMYAGSIKAHTTLYNVVRAKKERVSRLLVMMADEQHEVQEMGEGNIVVAVGLKHTSTGDTLVQSESTVKSLDASVILPAVEPPPAVFFCSVEPSSQAHQKDLDRALSCLSMEDPSLRVSTNQETGQTILSGMGELHLEVIHHRLRKDFKLDCSLGKLQVAYKECPTVGQSKSGRLRRTLSSKSHSVDLSLDLLPAKDDKPQVTISADLSPPNGISKEDVEEAVRTGVFGACAQGPLLAFPVQGVSVDVTDLVIGRDTSLPFVSACVMETVAKALREASVQLMEPLTHIEVSVPDNYVGSVLSDLSNTRRAQVQEVATSNDGKLISALVPLACLTGYSSALRSLTSGTATFTSSFAHYTPVPKEVERTVIEQIRGYLPS